MKKKISKNKIESLEKEITRLTKENTESKQ